MRRTTHAEPQCRLGILLCLTFSLVSCGLSGGPLLSDGPYDGQFLIQGGQYPNWMAIGESVQFTASVYRNSGGYTPVEATWSSMNENIVHVTQAGLATVVGTGDGVIKAEYRGDSDIDAVFGIPNFAGTWTADLVVTACVASTGFTQAWCDSTVGTVSTVRFDLTQIHDRVSGSWTRNGASAPMEGAPVRIQGGNALLRIGGGLLGGPTDAVSSVFDLTCADSQHFTGSFTYDWREPGTIISRGTTTSGEVRSGLKQ